MNLVLDVDATVSGYWSDGTANVEITTSLRNVGNLQFKDVQQISVTCSQGGEAVSDCAGKFSVSLPDGFGPATETLTLRVPMGQVSLEFDYGEDETHALMVDVPERILGVERDVWECFSDRGEPGEFNLDFPCSGWYTETIVKWDQDKPVKVWANPDVNPKYILILEQVLEVVSPILNLEFQWVAAEAEADFLAHVGVDRSNADDIGIHCVDGGGCGLKTVKDGVAYRGRLAVWGLGAEDDDYVYGTTLHEALHSLVPIGHRQRDATSIMSYNSVVDERVIHRMDEALLRLHSHPLIQPGMTMARVRELVVLRDELLDQPELAPLTPMRILEEAYLRLQAAGSAHYTVSLSESNCSDGFGPAVYETANYSFEGPRWTHINDGSDRYYMVQHDERINYEFEQPNRGELWSNNTGEWREVDWDKSGRSEALRLYNESSLQDVLIEIFSRPDAADVEVLGRSDGDLTLKARLREEGRHLPASTEITMVLDEQSYEIREYRVKWPAGARCGVSEMRAHDGRYGVEFEFPDAVTEKSEYLSSCGLQTLGTLSGAVTRRAVLPGYCGSDPERSALLFHFRLDSHQSIVNVIAKWHPGPLALRLLDEGETLARGTSSYFTPSTQMNAALREGEYIVEIETFDALVRGGFDLEVSITPFRSAASVSNGIEHSCALDVEGTPFCWGRTDFLDIDPPAHESFQSISSGAGHTCGLLQDGSAICWGTSFFGETQPPDGERFSAISGGALFTCALRLDGHPVCWGDDSSGQASPPANEEFIAISSGERHACALRADGTPVCWGGGSDRSNSGQASPPDGETLTSISSGSWHTCGLRADGTPICWGTYMVCWLNPDDTVGCEAPDGPSPAQPPADEKFTALSNYLKMARRHCRRNHRSAHAS